MRKGAYRSYSIRGSNIRFRANDLTLLAYYYHPSIEAKLNSTGKYYELKDSGVLTLNFLSDTTEEVPSPSRSLRRPPGRTGGASRCASEKH